jgi:hypothetical protein
MCKHDVISIKLGAKETNVRLKLGHKIEKYTILHKKN